MFYGSKGGSSSFKQTPDNLRSNDTFEGVMGVGIGPMRGPTRGLKSIKLDGTALENADGSSNFGSEFVANIGDGDPGKFPQIVQLKLGAGASPTQVGLTLTSPSPGPGPWVVKTLNNTNADFIDLRFIVSQLYRQDSKGIYNLTGTIEIQLKPVGSTNWIAPTIGTPSGSYTEQGIDNGVFRTLISAENFNFDGTWAASTSSGYPITGKTQSPAVYELRLAVPNTGNYANTAWDVRCRLDERDHYDDGNGNTETRSFSWESLSAVYSSTMGDQEDWRGVTWLQLYGKASDQLTGVPEITGEWDAKIVSVPPSSIFNGETRTYSTNIWDGSWAKAWTNDPAWVINDAISDSLSGLSLVASGSYLNKWDALEASKWYSQQVPDGNGGTEPRFSMNLTITEPQKAEELIRYLAGAVSGLAWDTGDGQWRLTVDKPGSAMDVFTLDNIQGEFVYSHTDVDTRFNDIVGQFKNKDKDYAQDAVRLYDNPSIALLGRKPTTIALVGCTGRQEAMRRLKLRLRSTVNENRIVTFTTNRRGRNIDPLGYVLIADGDLGAITKPTTGRGNVRDGTNNVIDFRDPIYLASGVTYQLVYTVTNPDYSPDRSSQPTASTWKQPTITKRVTISSDASNYDASVTSLKINETFDTNLPAYFSFAIDAPSLPTMPRLFRVLTVAPQDDGELIAVSAINVDTGKWDAADNVSKQDTVFVDLRGQPPAPTLISGQALLSLVRVPLTQGDTVNLQANWVRPPGAFISGFQVNMSVNGGQMQQQVDRQQQATWEMTGVTPGIYTVEIRTLDRRGGLSDPLTGTLEVTQGLINATQIRYNNGQTIQALQPAQAGADVTGLNVSYDTTRVGGVLASTLVSNVNALMTNNDPNSAGAASAAAQAARDAAQTAATNAQNANTAAAAARDAAQTAATNAQGYATNAGSASTNASAANVAAQGASTSALGYASSAAAVQALLFPSDMKPTTPWTPLTTGTPANRLGGVYASSFYTTVNGIGSVFQNVAASGFFQLASVEALKPVAGRTYEVELGSD